MASLLGGVASAGTTPFATQPYLMAVLACRVAQCPNPATHHVYLVQSRDGLHWAPIPEWRSFPGSVPDLVRRGGTIYLYALTPGGPGGGLTLIRVNEANGVPSPPVTVKIKGLHGNLVDPSILLDPSGRLMLSGLVVTGVGYDPAGCPPPATSCQKVVDSATEVPGSNGAVFRLDPGSRVTVDISPAQPIASDPSLFSAGRQWVMEVSEGPSVVAYSSSALRGPYGYVGQPSQNSGGVPSGYYDSTTHQYWTYVSFGPPNGPSVIRRAVSATLTAPIPDAQWTTVLTAATLGLGTGWSVQSPGFALNRATPPNP